VGLEPSGIPEFVWCTIRGTLASEEAEIQKLESNYTAAKIKHQN
jgi:hypothetical protein